MQLMYLPTSVPIVWAVPVLDQPALRRAFLALYERACLQAMSSSVDYATRYDPIEFLSFWYTYHAVYNVEGLLLRLPDILRGALKAHVKVAELKNI